MQELENLIIELEKYSEISKTQANSDLSKLRSKAVKRVKDTNKRLDIIIETVVRFKEDVDEVEASAMDKYSNKIFETVNLTINKIEKPENITLRSLETYSEATRSAFLQQDAILIKYVKLLKGPKYGKRVKSLSKALQKLNGDLTKLERFITTEYAPSANIENISTIIEDVLSHFDKIEETFNFIIEKENLVKEKEVEILQIQKELEEIQKHPIQVELQESKDRISSLQKKSESMFVNVRKAMRKYENNISKMKNKPDTTLLKELMKDLSYTIASKSSISGIELLLWDLKNELENAALKLKKEKREATKNDIDKLLDGGLQDLWQNAKNIYATNEELIQRFNELELDDKETKIKTLLDVTKRDRNRIIEREKRDFERVYENAIKSIEEVSNEIKATFDPNVNLKIEIIPLPEWSNIMV
ncbi:MAG: hypothetical protein HeimC2_17330 [Candidatus Heimdallarchaeota archaeon LC_2]|nr:MAG: hypothetical protein HeimC2_17330 [Candidatus Heimdallarchaeota archaeon LC_2]